MLFHTIEFLYFIVAFFVLYWFIFKKNLKGQNILILIASYVFYGWWDWRFLSLIALSTVVDYVIGIKISKSTSKHNSKILLWISIIFNIGMLGFFKYFNFFIENFALLLESIGFEAHQTTLNIILPVGISFYTFQTLSYTIDVYREKIKPTSDFISFAAFVSFFPQLVAGPIERASHLLPQFYRERKFDYLLAVDGSKQILWGLFSKVVIADKSGEIANLIFNNSSNLHGSSLILGAIFFAFQIYGDFAGYSHIAIGVSRLLGFDLMQNFAFPYFSRDIAEFWRRWHISLSTWFRDYLYIPLGGSKGGTGLKVRNTFVIFLVSGFWHGANWTFIFWGFLNALYFLPLLLTNKNKTNTDTVSAEWFFPSFVDFSKIIGTFLLTCFAWIFFRAENIGHAFQYITGIFYNTTSLDPFFNPGVLGNIYFTLVLIAFFLISEWFGRHGQFGIQRLFIDNKRIVRWSYYSVLVFFIMIYYQIDRSPFIYFQF
ncbi:MBOAT family O-acyltransferase [Lunatibacter salilacus]|uniref:MBOAT family O-acyltransferase n=1 Tax=Lunatibacter salilacus TaxID=2483804 RepID=UPI00131CAD47|nr:MBOAT family O-acyltransferase [Lunatibacter salilacus]